MKKITIYFLKFFILLISIINLSINIEAMPKENTSIPNHIKIDVEDKILNTVEYENFYLDAQRINTSVGPGYCLEVEKDYPSGQTFKFVGKPAKQVVGMMANGYPNKTPLEIGVDTEDNAYFATQVAIWCVTEGYSPYKFKSKDKQLLKAIESIYEQGIEYKGNELDHIAMEYYFNNCIQRIVVYINKEIEKPGGNDIQPGEPNDDIPLIPDAPDNNKPIVPDNSEEIPEIPNVPEDEVATTPDIPGGVPTLPEIPDDEDMSDKNENVVVPGLG